MGDKAAWAVPLGICVVCLFLAPSLASVGQAGPVLILLAGISATLAVLGAIRGKIRLPRDRYDLQELRQVDEQLKLEEIEAGFVAPDADEIVCPHYGHPFHRRFPLCPTCRHSP